MDIISRSACTALGLAAALSALLALPPTARGGLIDTPLPTFSDGQHAQFSVLIPAVIKRNFVETAVICTNLSLAPMDIGLELFDETGTLRNSVAGLDSDLPVYRIRTARALVDQSLGSISLLGSLLGAFALVGLLLAAIGIYGVVSYTVVQRTGELGIRLALGAQRRDVMWLVLGKGAFLVVSGALLGVAGAYGVSRVLLALIPSLPTRDPLILAITSVALVAVALVACYIPARRATKVDPLIALRSE